VFVTMEARTSCPLCGYQIRVIMCGSARINKRSMRVEPTLGALSYSTCPECGSDVRSASSVPRSAYVLRPDDAAKVSEYRQRKWGVSDPPGPLVEARRVA
jgi:rRNA maturation protein Nop10